MFITNPLLANPSKFFGLQSSRFLSRTRAFNASYPSLKIFFFAFGGFFTLKAIGNYSSINKANEEIQFRKKQLAQPVYELKGEELVNFPWSNGNLKEWLHRPVKIVGRPLHNRAVLIPSRKYGHEGYEYIVPLCTNENEDGSVQEGIFLNKGWMPSEWRQVCSRERIEDASPQEFTAFVTVFSELERDLFQKGNSPVLSRNKWNHVDLELMAKNSPFVNQKAVKLAALDCVDLNTPLDQYRTDLLDLGSSHTEVYPHRKTRAGALQLKEMPWEMKTNASNQGVLGLAASGLGFLLLLA